MSIETMPRRKSAHVLSEQPYLSKDQITLSGATFVNGEVVGQKADKSAYVKLDLNDSATDGAAARAVLFVDGDVDATAEDVVVPAHVRVTALDDRYLVWPDSMTAARKIEFLDDLAPAQVIVR